MLHVLLFFAAATPVVAADSSPAPVEVRIGVPGGYAAGGAVRFGEGTIRVDLPADAVFPLDMTAASQGLIHKAEVKELPPKQVRVELRLASAVLDSVRWSEDALVLSLRRRAFSEVGTAPAEGAGSYRLGVDDKVLIGVNGQPSMTQEAVVTARGTINAPLVGEVPAAGLTVPELSASLVDRLARDYLVDPRVNLQVLEYRSQWVVVSGEVRNPGRMALRGESDLKSILAEAGGLTPEAGSVILLSRPNADGKIETTTFLREDLDRGAVSPALRHGDTVTVEKVQYAFVNGEVRGPGRIRVEPGLTLLRAIALAGGLTEWANAKSVQIMSDDPSKPARTYNLRDIEAGKLDDPHLEGGELIIVKRRFL